MKKALLLLIGASILVSLPGCCWWRRHCEDACEEKSCGPRGGRYHRYHEKDCNSCGYRHAGRCEDGSCARDGHHKGYRHREVVEE